MLNMSGAIVFQSLLGKLLDSFRNGLANADGTPLYTFMMYKNAFLVIIVCMSLSMFLLLFIDDLKMRKNA
jgi:hypothetical protein